MEQQILVVLTYIILLFGSGPGSSEGQVKGVVVNEQEMPMEGVTLALDGPIKREVSTDETGTFNWTDLPFGAYVLKASFLGYETATLSFELDFYTQEREFKIILPQALERLENVVVQGKSKAQHARELPVKAVVVDVQQASKQPATLAELMNRSPGVRIRQSGGVGTPVDVSINGFQGNSVQYFRDGIPLEYLGGGYGIHNVPTNLLERVDIFKGVVPIYLGGDALGGAVNVIPQEFSQRQLNMSYEVASFHTHLVNFHLYQPIRSNFFAGWEGFFNYSRNNYDAEVQIVDAHANPVPTRVELFHNGYKQFYSDIFAGVKDLSWADELRFSLATYGVERQAQHPALMTNPYGAMTTHNRGIVPSLRYKKNWGGRFELDQFVSYSDINRGRTDTVHGTFDWYGRFTPRAEMGESPRRSLARLDFSNVMSRTNGRFHISDQQILEANFVYQLNKRVGSDPYGLRFKGTDIDVLSREATYLKTVAGLSWQSKWMDDRLTNQFTLKHFHYGSKGINGFMANENELNHFVKNNKSNWGWGQALKFQLNQRSYLRASYEMTNRLPRESELFGDNDTRAPNFNLLPERSFNAHLSYAFSTSTFGLELGGFYRKTKGMIMLVPVQPPFAQYQNLDSIRGYGFDIDFSYRVHKNWNLTANTTWQDNRMIDIGDPIHQWMEGTRLRNTPYFFANMGVNGQYQGVLRTMDKLHVYGHWNFIREFYLNQIPRDKEPQGFLGLFGKAGVPVTNIIPDQHLLTLGLNYFFGSSPLHLGFEIKNLTNEKLFDYYKIERAGRSFHLKINYQF